MPGWPRTQHDINPTAGTSSTSKHDMGANPGGWGSRPPDFGHGGRRGSRNIIISYHVQKVGLMFGSDEF